jgi:hypothetical protein
MAVPLKNADFWDIFMRATQRNIPEDGILRAFKHLPHTVLTCSFTV